MSIFKDSFHLDIKKQLEVRQNAINNRTSRNLQYYNSRNAWVRLSSSVNIVTEIDNEGNVVGSSNELAKKYILQGGILNDSKARDGIGDFSRAYSANSSDNRFNRLGIRPMPGITSIDIKSKGAYGSLREATVRFQCWDIKQLEDLELLYMRQGYTVLLEWGWTPYLNNNGDLSNIVDYTDIINKSYTKEELFKLQYDKSTKDYKGNYDAMYGFIKNYSWTARMDGGYDCVTTIISIGEVIESLKVNYAPFDSISKISSEGLLSSNIVKTDGSKFDTSIMNLSGSYSKNILAGLFEEMWQIGRQLSPETSDEGKYTVLHDNKYNTNYDIFHKTIDIKSDEEDFTGDGSIGKTDEQVYISLETLTHLLNNYVLLSDTKASKPFTSISVYESNLSNNPTSGSNYLLALAHPLQMSIDPTVCLIKNNLWINGIKLQATTDVDVNSGNTIVKYGTKNFDPTTPEGKKWWDVLLTKIKAADTNSDNDRDLINYVKSYIGTSPNSIEEVKELQRVFLEIKNKRINYNPFVVPGRNIAYYDNFYDLLDEGLDEEGINEAIGATDNEQNSINGAVNIRAAKVDPKSIVQEQINSINTDLSNKGENIKYLQFLNTIERSYFVNNDWTTELGIIGNIFVNVGMLYNLSVSEDLAAQDRKEKNDIAVYDFLKQVLSKISYSIGQVNNFDLFVDPVDNVAKIIDINYVDRMKSNEAYSNAFEIQVQNLNAVVRSYKLESQVFPEQSTIIAIGAQAGGGALGSDANTLINFNKNIIDRVIPKKESPTNNLGLDKATQVQSLINSLNILFEYIADLKWDGSVDADFYVDKVKDYANALKDIINFFKNISTSRIKNKAIIPTKLSITMDGIGGVIIGNIFKLPEEVLPKGYKRNGDNIGARVGYIVTGIGHNINNNDWTTTLEAQTIILDEYIMGIFVDYSNIKLIIPVTKEEEIKIDTNTNKTVEPSGIGEGQKALRPDISAILDKDLDIIQGSFTTNTGKVNNLAVIDGKPVGIEVAKAFLLMQRASAKDGIDLKISSAFRSPYTSIKGKTSRGNTVSTSSQSSLYDSYLKNKKPLAAAPGRSNHGNEIALDLNTGSVTGAISPLKKNIYQWLIDNAYRFGFVRWVAKEEWHWEYRPGEYQYNTRVPKNNPLYKGMQLN